MKIEINIPKEKLQELLDACGYADGKTVTVDMLKHAIYDGLFNIYKTGIILKARDSLNPVIDKEIIEVK